MEFRTVRIDLFPSSLNAGLCVDWQKRIQDTERRFNAGGYCKALQLLNLSLAACHVKY